MKKIMLALFISASSISAFAAGPGVDQKVLDAFSKTFADATAVSWTELPGAYQVSFTQDKVIAKVTYDTKGNIVKTLRYYHQEQLPFMILSNINKRFAGQRVHGIVEESTEVGVIYHVTLESAKHWTTVRADNYGDLSVEKKFRKA